MTPTAAKAFRFEISKKNSLIGILTFDLPGEKVNKLNRPVMQEFAQLLQELKKEIPSKKVAAVILISGKPGNFIAGADIEMLQATGSAEEAESLSRQGQDLMNDWEDLASELGVPTVAAIQGAAMGGGCEFALACSAIVLANDPSTRIGLPETMLGILPGMGGCVRLPRKIGIAGALDIILAGKSLVADKAFRTGLVEAVLPKEDFLGNVERWVLSQLPALKRGVRLGKEPKLGGVGGLIGKFLEGTAYGRGVIYRKAREGVLKKTYGNYPSPLEVLKVFQANSTALGPKLRGEKRAKAMAIEAKAFGKMAATDVSKNLIRIFFQTEAIKKKTGVQSGTEANVKPCEQAAVLGAGVMGGGIAQLFADRGIFIRMKDINNPALSLGVQSACRVFQGGLQRKKISIRQFQQKLNLIRPTLDFQGFGSVNVVVEAVIEKMDIKKSVLADVEKQVSKDCIIATNTSSLSVTEMQGVLQRPENFVGMHFFNPVHRMPLVEVIVGKQSSPTAISTIYQLSKRLGKTPIVVKDGPGFLVNRLLMPYLNEATYLVADGAPIPELDKVILKFGMPMGPMELIDEVGVDVGDKVAHILHDAFGSRFVPSPINAKVVQSGRLGKKNGKGLYDYPQRKKQFNPEIYKILGVTPQSGKISEQEMIDRCVLPMINEASRCLADQIVDSAESVDLGMLMGTGFPPFRGGLLRYADILGAKEVVDRLEKLAVRFGARYAPAPAIREMASRGQKFHS